MSELKNLYICLDNIHEETTRLQNRLNKLAGKEEIIQNQIQHLEEIPKFYKFNINQRCLIFTREQILEARRRWEIFEIPTYTLNDAELVIKELDEYIYRKK